MSESYFEVAYGASAQIEMLPVESELPEVYMLDVEIPPLFRIADTIDHLDPHSAKNLRKYGTEFSRLVDHVNAQTNKLNSLLCYLMEKECAGRDEYLTATISGNGFTFHPKGNEFKQDSKLKIKLFFPEFASAIYCYGTVETIDPETGYVRVSFSIIRDEDRERVISVVTRHQQKLLRARAEEKNKNK